MNPLLHNSENALLNYLFVANHRRHVMCDKGKKKKIIASSNKVFWVS